jgi:hypothetical protein
VADQALVLESLRGRAIAHGHAMSGWMELHAKADVHTSVCTRCQAQVIVDFPARTLEASPKLYIACIGDKITLLEKEDAASRQPTSSPA